VEQTGVRGEVTLVVNPHGARPVDAGGDRDEVDASADWADTESLPQ